MDKGIPEKVESLFSDEEKDSLLRDFISAYFRKAVDIDYQQNEPQAAMMRQLILKVMGAARAPELIMAKYKDYPEIQLILHARGVGDKEFYNFDFRTSKDMLLTMILAYRQGNRIDGKFTESVALEAKLRLIELEIEKVLKAIEGLAAWQEKYEPTIKEAEKYYKDKADRVKPAQGGKPT